MQSSFFAQKNTWVDVLLLSDFGWACHLSPIYKPKDVLWNDQKELVYKDQNIISNVRPIPTTMLAEAYLIIYWAWRFLFEGIPLMKTYQFGRWTLPGFYAEYIPLQRKTNKHTQTLKFPNVFSIVVGFLRGGCSRGGGNWGTLRIPREDWGTLGNIRED